MPFDAIVHAPALRPGARINIAEADQVEARQPAMLAVGAEVRLRFGVCAPERSCGRIIGYATDPGRAVLAVAAGTWILRRGDGGGVAVPGLLSETWFVVAASEVPASPTDHTFAYSAGRAATED